MYKGTLNEVLTEIGKQLSLPADDLIKYASEAPYAATRPDGNLWPSGTGSINEKRILYAITRASQFVSCLDIGTRWGAMALQIASANHAKGIAYLRTTSIDVESTIHGSKQKVGKFIPETYGVELITSDAVKYLKHDKYVYELIFEDTAHTYEMTKAIYELAPERLVPGGVIISHDAVHPKFKGQVVAGIKANGIEPNVYLVEGDSCGLAIWQKPTLKLQVSYTEAEIEIPDETKVDNEEIKEAPKRRKRRRKKASKSVTRNCVGCGVDISKIYNSASLRTGRCIICYKVMVESGLPEHAEEAALFDQRTEEIYGGGE